MRDFSNGGDITVGGDFHIIDQSQQGKLLVNCTNEELLEEEENCRKVNSEELFKKIKFIAVAVAVLVFSAAIYFLVKGVPEHFNSLATIAAFLVAFGSVKFIGTHTDVEQVAEINLRAINSILRMRGARR